MRSNTAIGIALGIVVGLFIDVLLLLLVNGWLIISIPHMLFPLIAGVIAGIFSMRKLPHLSWWYLAVILVLGFVLMSAPQKLIHARLVSLADALPLYPGAELTDRMVIEGCSDNDAPWVRSIYQVNVPSATAIDYVTQQLRKTWKADPKFENPDDVNIFFSLSGKQKVIVEYDSDSTYRVYMDVYEFCGRNRARH